MRRGLRAFAYCVLFIAFQVALRVIDCALFLYKTGVYFAYLLIHLFKTVGNTESQ